MRYASTLFLLILFLSTFLNASAQSSNAGIVKGLWYSKENIFAGEKVRVYIAIRNNTESDLKGIVEFFDGDKKLERQNVQALSGRIIESWTDWTPSYGSHSLKATLTRTELSTVGSSTAEVVVVSALAEDTLFVDYDTDKDSAGDEKDSDDDGDGKSDTDEKAAGTDPLVKNVAPAVETAKSESIENDKPSKTPSSTPAEDGDTSNISEGLEQYLAPSRAESVLSTVSEYIETTKQKVDSYRVARRDADRTQIDAETTREEGRSSTTQMQTSAGGFGEVERDSADGTQKNAEGFLDKALRTISAVSSNVYTLILWIVSFVLGHPMFVQLAILLGILLTILRLAAKFGRRKSRSQ